MAIAALVTWILTAGGGFLMLGIWISRGGPKERRSDTRLPPPVIFSHFGLAALGLVLWLVYVFTGSDAIAWTGFALLVPVAVLGFIMLVRWLPIYRAGTGTTGGALAGTSDLPEQHFPVPVVAGHGVLAVATVVLAFLAALGL